MKQIETSTLYFTPSGNIEVPGAPIQIPDIIATRQSNLAPLWLIFNGLIVNTSNLTFIELFGDEIKLYAKDGKRFSVTPSNINEAWKSLQDVFSKGLPPN